jgi:hypothetical protein
MHEKAKAYKQEEKAIEQKKNQWESAEKSLSI